MTEMLERITPEMSEEEVLGVILDEIMARAEPGVAEAILLSEAQEDAEKGATS